MIENELSTAIGDLILAIAQTKFSTENFLKLKKILGSNILIRHSRFEYFIEIAILTSLPAEILQKNMKLIAEME